MNQYKNDMNYDVLDFCEDTDALFVDGNILKYLLRNKEQDEKDIEKALVYRRKYKYTISLSEDNFHKLCNAYNANISDLSRFLSSELLYSEAYHLAVKIKKQAVEHAKRT